MGGGQGVQERSEGLSGVELAVGRNKGMRVLNSPAVLRSHQGSVAQVGTKERILLDCPWVGFARRGRRRTGHKCAGGGWAW